MDKVFVGMVVALIFTWVMPSVVGAETLKGQIVDQGYYLKDKTDNVGRDQKCRLTRRTARSAAPRRGTHWHF